MQLKEIFDMYFSGDISYENLKDLIRERNTDEASKIFEILDAVEQYFQSGIRKIA